MTETNNTNRLTEMETFIPQDGTANGTTISKYKVNKDPGALEAADVTLYHDVFKTRTLEHPVSNTDTLAHLLKASLGSGILSMPAAFQASGLLLGIFSTILVSMICTHCSYILVVCAHELYKRSGKSSMSFAEVAEEACLKGPKWARKFGTLSRIMVQSGIFVTYFATCSCYSVIIAKNLKYVADHYMEGDLDIRIFIAALLVFLLPLAYVPNLKKLAPISMVANIFMGVGLAITFYYLVNGMPGISERELAASISTLPISISITMFAIEAIGVVMPLENHMKTPQSFVGICGVLNQGMSGVTLVYIVLGFFGYLRYGDQTAGSITLNLPKDEYAAQAVNIMVALAVFCTFGLQFYVALDIAWTGIKDRFTSRATLANYTLRTVMVIICVLIAVACPEIVPFVSLIGAFCFSILGLMCPIFIEIITFWEKGFGKFNWKLWKDVIVILIGCLALVFGSKGAIEDIYKNFSS